MKKSGMRSRKVKIERSGTAIGRRGSRMAAVCGELGKGRRLRRVGHALTGLTGFWLTTWACARWTRSSPGYHIGGLQPQKRGCAMHPPRRQREWHLWRLRRELSEENGELMGMRRWPESGGSFSMQSAGGESVGVRYCPEIGGGKAEGYLLGSLQLPQTTAPRRSRCERSPCTRCENPGISRIDFLVLNGSSLK